MNVRVELAPFVEIGAVALRDGRLAIVRQPTFRDLLIAQVRTPSPHLLNSMLMTQCVVIDGEVATLEDILDLPLPEWREISALINAKC